MKQKKGIGKSDGKPNAGGAARGTQSRKAADYQAAFKLCGKEQRAFVAAARAFRLERS
ncbi:hypothetical protein HMPREF0860_0853, partial [Treponema socranskii subsp. socranskii VPI DR56BR1116 = ATCC 35536]